MASLLAPCGQAAPLGYFVLLTIPSWFASGVAGPPLVCFYILEVGAASIVPGLSRSVRERLLELAAYVPHELALFLAELHSGDVHGGISSARPPVGGMSGASSARPQAGGTLDSLSLSASAAPPSPFVWGLWDVESARICVHMQSGTASCSLWCNGAPG